MEKGYIRLKIRKDLQPAVKSLKYVFFEDFRAGIICKYYSWEFTDVLRSDGFFEVL